MHSHPKITFNANDLKKIVEELTPELDKKIKESQGLLAIFNKLNEIAAAINKINADLKTSSFLLTEISSSADANKEKYISSLSEIRKSGFSITTAGTNLAKLKLDMAQFVQKNPQLSSVTEKINQKITIVEECLRKVATEQQSQQTQITNIIKALSTKNSSVMQKTSLKI